MELYLDTCCYGRPYDDMSQAGVKAEYAAILNAIHVCEFEGFPIFGSPMLVLEINQIPDSETRENVMAFYRETVNKKTPLTAQVEARAAELQAGGLRKMDSYHAALSESAGVDYLLTTDAKFEKAAARLGVKTNVINPINFLQEYLKWLQQST